MRQDLLVDENNHPIIRNGDLSIGVSDTQHIRHITILQKGELKHAPALGLGGENYLKSNISPQRFKRDLKVELNKDQYTPRLIDTSRGLKNLIIEL